MKRPGNLYQFQYPKSETTNGSNPMIVTSHTRIENARIRGMDAHNAKAKIQQAITSAKKLRPRVFKPISTPPSGRYTMNADPVSFALSFVAFIAACCSALDFDFDWKYS